MCTSHEWTKYRHMYILIVPILWHASVSVSIVVESFACHVWVSTQPYVHVLYMILGISVYDVKPGFCQCPMDEPASMGLVRSRANHPKRFIGGHTRPQKNVAIRQERPMVVGLAPKCEWISMFSGYSKMSMVEAPPLPRPSFPRWLPHPYLRTRRSG